MSDASVASGVTSAGLVISSGTVTVSSGGTAIDTVLSGKANAYTGFLNVERGGVAINTTVEGNGRLTVYAGGTATSIKESGGFVGVLDGATVRFAPNWFSEAIPYMGTATIHSGTTGYRTSLAKGATLFIYSGGIMESSTLAASGYVHVSSGGYASFTYVFESSCLNISSGGTAKTVIINDSGSAVVMPGGTMQNVTLESGRLTVSSGALVSSITVSQGGELYVESGGSVLNLTSKTGGMLYSSAGATVSFGNGGGGGTSSGGSQQIPTLGDRGWNNYVYDKKKKPDLNTSVSEMTPIRITSDTGDIRLDNKGEISHGSMNNFVGYGDEADFVKITLNCAAKLAFNISTTGGAKFTIWSLTVTGYDKNENPKYKMKALQTITIKKNDCFSPGTANIQKAPILEAGEYYISMEASSTKKGSEVYYGVTLNSVSTFYSKGDDFDDGWRAFNKDDYSGKGNLGKIDGKKKKLYEEWVGVGDEIDYRKFTLASAAKLSFSVFASDQLTFSLCRVDEKTGKQGTPQLFLNTLQSVKLKKQRGGDDYAASTDGILLEAGVYYLCAESPNAAKGGNADYTVNLDTAASVFFDHGDNSDDWDDMEKKGARGKVGTITGGKLDGTKETVLENWVGFGDAVDYRKFTLASAAKVSFAVIGTDALKFSVCRLESKDGKNDTTVYSLKSLLSASAKQQKDGRYLALTKSIMLDSGDYYFCVESSNAAKGGNADYTVNLDTGESVFFNQGDNTDDWDDMEKKGAKGKVLKFGTITATTVLSNWVGYGDAVDYRQITLKNDTKLRFELYSRDQAKFTIYRLDEKTGRNKESTFSLKALQTTKVRASDLMQTKAVKLEAGDYYICMESTNAAKGGNAEYDIGIFEFEEFLPSGKNASALTMPKDEPAASADLNALSAGDLLTDGLSAGQLDFGEDLAGISASVALQQDDVLFPQTPGMLA